MQGVDISEILNQSIEWNMLTIIGIACLLGMIGVMGGTVLFSAFREPKGEYFSIFLVCALGVFGVVTGVVGVVSMFEHNTKMAGTHVMSEYGVTSGTIGDTQHQKRLRFSIIPDEGKSVVMENVVINNDDNSSEFFPRVIITRTNDVIFMATEDGREDGTLTLLPLATERS